jgi:hypothetical protein
VTAPAAHGAHAELPVALANWPAAQSVHDDCALDGFCWPSAHSVQLTLPGTLV